MRVRRLTTKTLAALALLPLAACEETGGGAAAGRPQSKPEALTAEIAGPGGRRQEARVETRRGEILILGLDGRVVPVPLSSAEGRRALGASEARIAEAAAADPAEPATPPGTPALSAQDALVADFEAQSAPVLPEAPEADAERPDPDDFLGARVRELSSAPEGDRPARRSSGQGGARLVEVSAEMKDGVDADTAFAYATCALAGWASRAGVPYARHIRTLQSRVNGRLRLASVFTVSDIEPMGIRIVEANQTLGECSARGIPAS